MLFATVHGVSIVESGTKANIDWVSDIVIKVLCGACTILLGIAVSSLQSMNSEIKQLSTSVLELSSQSKVINFTIVAQEKRLDKIEIEIDKIKSVPPKRGP